MNEKGRPPLKSADDQGNVDIKGVTRFFKHLKLETLTFDNQPQNNAGPSVPLLPAKRQNFRQKKYQRNAMQVFNFNNADNNSMILQSTFVIQAILNMLCQHIKDDEDQRKSLFTYMFKQLENLHVVSPLCAEECFESIRNEYINAFSLLIFRFTDLDHNDQRNDLVIAKPSSSKEALAHSLSVLGNFMPPDWSPMSFLQASRYQSEYIEESKLGSGGFGKVYKVRHRVDEKQYAVKKICLPRTDANALKAVVREVQLMASLKHENIVMYYNAWWEHCGMMTSDNQSLDSLDMCCSSSDSPCRSEGKPSFDWPSHSSKKLQGLSVMLYVQMELCGMTLEDFMRDRNQNLTLSRFSDNLEVVDFKLSDSIFQQILIAVHYLHSQDLMHRDLKPPNIFLDKEGRKVKLGDFGLARSICVNVGIEEVPSTPLTPFSTYAPNFTAKLGTGTYAAPEQLESSNYSKKADMYSLGLIYFELLYPFGDTAMERSKTLASLRKAEGVIPEVGSIEKRWPHQASVIRQLLQHRPEGRPTAAELLDIWPSKSDKDIIRELQEQLKEKDDTIRKQGTLIKQLNKQKKMLWKRIGQLRKNIKQTAVQ